MTKPKFGGSLQCVSRYGFSILDFSYCGKQRAILDFITMIYHNCWFLQAPFFGWINLPRLKWFYLGGHTHFQIHQPLDITCSQPAQTCQTSQGELVVRIPDGIQVVVDHLICKEKQNTANGDL